MIRETVVVGEQVQIFLSGCIYFDEATEMRENFTYLMNKGHKFFLVDLSQVVYIDCMGLGVLIFVRNNLMDKGGTVKLTGLQGIIKKLVVLTKLNDEFEILSDD